MPALKKKTIRDIPLDDKIVLLRADYNVPLTPDGKISDDFRIRSSIPSLKYLISRNCRIVICSHLGRPDGKANPEESLEPVASHLGKLLDQEVSFIAASIGDQVVQAVKKLRPGTILLLENLRFHPGEEANDQEFARSLARDSGAHYFVQDGFGVVHRKHASTDVVTQFLPSVAGLLLEKEYKSITDVVESPERPMIAILGGAKISDKIAVIERFISIADTIVVGGAMANTFLKYNGRAIGKSLHEDGLEETIGRIYAAVEKRAVKSQDFLILPTDVAVSRTLKGGSRSVTSIDRVDSDDYILDIGPDTIETIVAKISQAQTAVWNGTLGMAEQTEFSHGSARTALALVQNTHINSVVGGGDTADFVLKWDHTNGSSFSHISTGGGASLELMAGEPMPGIDALLDC